MVEIYDQEKDQGPILPALPAPTPNGRPEVVEPEPQAHEHATVWQALQAEWDFYFAKGPPQTYTNGDLMDPRDASAIGSLTSLGWVVGLVVLAGFVVLVILAINGT